MTETSMWASWFGVGPVHYIIFGLIVLNLAVVYWALLQKHHRSKLERDILVAQTFGSTPPFATKLSNAQTSKLGKNARDDGPEHASLLKIDQAIKMLKAGSSLEEIKSALDIEASYLQILARHHRT